MATLSVLSYGLPQALNHKMKANENGSSNHSSNSGNGSSSLGKTFNKITVQNVLGESNGNSINISNNTGGSSNHMAIAGSINNANAIVKKIKDFGMIGTVNAVHSSASTSSTSTSSSTPTSSPAAASRKRPQAEAAKKTSTPVAKKPKLGGLKGSLAKAAKKPCENAMQSKLIANVVGACATGTPGRKGLPAPQAVARRNARERNRVKQVNNGFAALRERIPEEVAEAFEAHGSGRGAAKKLSKVETLRMAVEYIRSLERLLGFDFPLGGGGGDGDGEGGAHLASDGDDSFALIKDEFGSLSPGLDDPYEDSLSNYDLDEDFPPPTSSGDNSALQPAGRSLDEQLLDLLPNVTTLNGLQYIRIPGTNTYQLLTADLFAGAHSPPSNEAEDDHFNALIDGTCLSPSSSSATTADPHSSPTSIMQTTAASTTAPALQTANGTLVRAVDAASSSLSRSPVPQTSPSTLQHQHQHQAVTALSPVANELLLQTCADEGRHFVAPTPPQQLLPSRMIKQEFVEADFAALSHSPPSGAIIYQPIMREQQQQQQQQQQQLLLDNSSMSMSPPLELGGNSAAAPVAALPGFFEHDHGGSFYEGVVTFKKELSDVMLDSSTATNGLSDESMMEPIDWWEAHTPKSDGGSVIM